MIQKATGLDEQFVVETETWADLAKAFEVADARLATTNNRIVEARGFIQGVKDPHYRYMFTAFLDSFLGISSNAESLQKRFAVERPPDYDKWYSAKTEAKPILTPKTVDRP